MARVRDMFTEEFHSAFGDIDVYDDYTEELGIAFCGMRLTEAGEKKFSLVLDDPIEVKTDLVYGDWTAWAVVKINDLPTGEDEKHLELLIELFEGAAGYCTVEEYEEWFEELQ